MVRIFRDLKCVRACGRTRACGIWGANGCEASVKLCVRSACVLGFLGRSHPHRCDRTFEGVFRDKSGINDEKSRFFREIWDKYKKTGISKKFYIFPHLFQIFFNEFSIKLFLLLRLVKRGTYWLFWSASAGARCDQVKSTRACEVRARQILRCESACVRSKNGRT